LNICRAAWQSNKRLAAQKGAFLFVGLYPGIRWDLINYGTEEEAAREKAKQERYDGYIIFKIQIKEYVGMTCIPEWISTEADFEQYWRNLTNKEASVEFSKIPFEEFRKTFCSGNADYEKGFSRRFRRLPEIGSPYRPPTLAKAEPP
jgi:hypothetical protein